VTKNIVMSKNIYKTWFWVRLRNREIYFNMGHKLCRITDQSEVENNTQCYSFITTNLLDKLGLV